MVNQVNEKEIEVAKVINDFKINKLTGKLELDFKDGQLAGGRKQIAIFK